MNDRAADRRPSCHLAPTGVIHGRFQIVHNDHLRYLLDGKRLCRHLVIGITNPDPFLTRDDEADPHRSSAEANPLSYFERYCLLRAVMREAGIPDDDFSIVPFPVNLPELYRHYVPLDALFFLTIYDAWGWRKYQLFTRKGLKVHVMREGTSEEKGISAGEVRRRMVVDAPWQELVPPASARLLNEWDLAGRLRRAVPTPPSCSS